MGVDKGTLVYAPTGENQRVVGHRLLSGFAERVFLSCRKEQAEQALECLVDDERWGDIGPTRGLLTAHAAFPDVAWLVFACDFPFADEKAVGALVNARDPTAWATAYVNGQGFYEPFFCIWEPAGLGALQAAKEAGPQEVLRRGRVRGLEALKREWLCNVNGPGEGTARKNQV